MTTPDSLKQLAERVEAATGPDRELDEAICAALYPTYELPYAARCAPTHIQSIVPRYSASLDAAMTLVPEGWCKTVADWWCGDDKPPFFADCGDLDALKADVDGIIFQAWAATPALALTAAALRARASIQDNHQ
jgi:hypothetical protein